jgi:hypothetical protein
VLVLVLGIVTFGMFLSEIGRERSRGEEISEVISLVLLMVRSVVQFFRVFSFLRTYVQFALWMRCVSAHK